jgi:hypothetical protein
VAAFGASGGEEPAAHPDAAMDAPTGTGRYPRDETRPPRHDLPVDAVDEGPVEIEQQRHLLPFHLANAFRVGRSRPMPTCRSRDPRLPIRGHVRPACRGIPSVVLHFDALTDGGSEFVRVGQRFDRMPLPESPSSPRDSIYSQPNGLGTRASVLGEWPRHQGGPHRRRSTSLGYRRKYDARSRGQPEHLESRGSGERAIRGVINAERGRSTHCLEGSPGCRGLDPTMGDDRPVTRPGGKL